MRGLIYTRVSSDDQVEGTSLASQEELCRRYCAQKGIEVVEVFRDEGETAKDLSLNNRTRFLAALEFCRKERPPIEAFVVFRVDRFARNTEDHFAVRRVLLNYGTALHSVTEPIGNRPAEKFIETVLAGAAEYDNAIRKQRCTDGMVARINQGIWPFKPPIGYSCAHHKKHGEKKSRPDEADGEVFLVIQRALRAYAHGEIVSQAALARQLNLWGFEKITAKKATNKHVDRLLGRLLPFYAGVLVSPWTGKEHAGLHQPMISRDEFARIRARRLGRSPHVPAKRTHFRSDLPLRRMICCDACGRFLTAANSSGNGGIYGYYFCLNHQCELRYKGIRSSVLHPAFSSLLRRLELSPEALPAIEKRIRALWQLRRTESFRLPTRDSRLSELAERRRRACEMREDGTYDPSTFKKRLESIDADIEALKTQPQQPLTIGDLDIEEVIESSRWFLGQLSEVWRQVTDSSHSRFERIAFPAGIQFDRNGTLRTAKPGLIFALSDVRSGEISTEVDLGRLSSNPEQEYQYFAELISFYHNFGKTALPQPRAA